MRLCPPEFCNVHPVRLSKNWKRYVCGPSAGGKPEKTIKTGNNCEARIMFSQDCEAWFECRCKGRVIAQQTIGGTGVNAMAWQVCHLSNFERGGAAACSQTSSHGFTLANAVVNLSCGLLNRGYDYCYYDWFYFSTVLLTRLTRMQTVEVWLTAIFKWENCMEISENDSLWFHTSHFLHVDKRNVARLQISFLFSKTKMY